MPGPSPSSSASSSASSSRRGSECASPNTPGTPISPTGVSSSPCNTTNLIPPPNGFNPCQSLNYAFVRPRAPSPYMRTLLLYVDAVNARDFNAMAATFDEALEHRILPKSMARPVLTKKLYVEYWKGVMALFAKFETKIHEVIEAGDKLTVHGSSRGKSWSGTPYTNEYVMIVHFTLPTAFNSSSTSTSPSNMISPYATSTANLPKIRYLKEFVDSSVSLDFFKEESERRRRVQGVGSPPRLQLNGGGSLAKASTPSMIQKIVHPSIL